MKLCLALLAGFLLLASCGGSPEPPREMLAADRPDDWGGAIRIEWSASPSRMLPKSAFTGYRVYRADRPLGPWSLVFEGDREAGAFTDTGAGDTAWYYRVTAVVHGVDSAPIGTPGPVTAHPNLKAVDAPNDWGGAVLLTWGAHPSALLSETTLRGFRLYRAADRAGPFEPLADVGADKGSYLDATAGTTPWFYRLTVLVDGTESPPVDAPEPVAALALARAIDRPKDLGGTIHVTWPHYRGEGLKAYRIYRGPGAEGPWRLLDEVPPPANQKSQPAEYFDRNAPEGPAFYRIAALAGGPEGASEVAFVATAAPVTAVASWFVENRYKSLLAVFIFTSIVLGWVWTASRKISAGMLIGFVLYAALYAVVILMADMGLPAALVILLLPLVSVAIPLVKRGGKIYIRPIPALQAVEEAIGRATEMGKPILFVPGISSIGDIATLAALNILSPVAEKAAQYDSRLIVPNYDPIVYTIAQEVVKEAYLKAGRPDAYSDENVFFLSPRQFAFAAAVSGLMMRERPATNFFLGMFYAESLILAETGNMTGAIQIAGTDAITQLPFFIVACDYTLIGEELYAAGAYMGGDPKLTGSLKGQDWNKALAILVILVLTGAFFVYGVISDPGKWRQGLRELPELLFKVEAEE
ncbi:MAG: fibronectin type III domain-containing protein [Planctomycetes bacterium]|nr:fibronectin type III domain-containing protein [Planctomycetota bacterium]